ncbi:tetratricopeptide repeat protein [Singulisphaera sp. PoT]|uniref:tetratricopeptide repeat protein n=1 Tax=Singulisphaera sp. PoT TaxID=3411797 RepID=UPI003BF48399
MIICEGHNEFLEDRSYAAVKQIPGFVKMPLEIASRLRTYQVLQSSLLGAMGAARKTTPPRTTLGPEVQAFLDFRGGLEAYHRDAGWRGSLISHFDYNLRRMVGMASEAGVHVMLVSPVVNLDIPPFKSQHRADLTPEQLDRWTSLYDGARSHYAGNLPAAIDLLEQALCIDDQHAGIHYGLAKCYQRLGLWNEAKLAFLRAKDEDVCPLRILEPMRGIIRDVARESGTPPLDADALFASRSPGNIVGSDWLVDHVHPSIVGHQLLANALTESMASQGVLNLNPHAAPDRDRMYREHFSTLDDAYFLMGQKRLGNQRLWSEGRGNQVWNPSPQAVEGPMYSVPTQAEATPLGVPDQTSL